MLRDLIARRDTPVSQINNPNMPLYQALSGIADGSPVRSGVVVTSESALRVMAVYACVRLIAETIAALPLHVYEGDGPVRTVVKAAEDRYIWDAPNVEMTRQVFWEQIIASALLDGNAFILTLRNGLGTISEIWPLDPNTINPRRASSGELVFEQWSGPTLTMDDITHIPAFTLPGRLRGLSPIGQAREAIGLSLAAEEFGARLFGNGTLIGGVIETDSDLSANGGAAARAIQSRWEQRNAGLQNAHRVTVIDNGGKFRQVGLPPEDAQFIETRRFQISEIARLYRVPPHMIADVERSTSWGSGIEQQNIAFVSYTLLAWIRRFEQAITKSLLPRRDRYALFNVGGLLRGDTHTRNASYTAGRNGGWYSINEIRAFEDKPPIEGGDDPFRPLNSATAGIDSGGAPDDDDISARGSAEADA